MHVHYQLLVARHLSFTDIAVPAVLRLLFPAQTPLWLSLLIIALEAPSVWWVYDRMQASHGPYWGSDQLVARTVAYCLVCATWSVLLELYWRRAYRLWLRSGGDHREQEALRLAGAGGTAAGGKAGGAGAKGSLKLD